MLRANERCLLKKVNPISRYESWLQVAVSECDSTSTCCMRMAFLGQPRVICWVGAKQIGRQGWGRGAPALSCLRVKIDEGGGGFWGKACACLKRKSSTETVRGGLAAGLLPRQHCPERRACGNSGKRGSEGAATTLNCVGYRGTSSKSIFFFCAGDQCNPNSHYFATIL